MSNVNTKYILDHLKTPNAYALIACNNLYELEYLSELFNIPKLTRKKRYENNSTLLISFLNTPTDLMRTTGLVFSHMSISERINNDKRIKPVLMTRLRKPSNYEGEVTFLTFAGLNNG